jgi:hypothetical protein
LKSPCIDICKFDRRSGWCIGCGRTKDECKRWKKVAKHKRKAIKAELPQRLEELEARDGQ